ncbi:unnamed protein product [Adineta ricciae]|uniref:Uncharacterized protein n=1 Tax=Adineta ricciae TaxID=249248 RepID=A0A813RAF0_ADIRI|nr:unnamed protein product [Adineta ricciae]
MQRTTVIQPTTTVNDLVQQEEAANDNAIWNVFRKMLFFTVMLTVAPLTSFFVSKYYVFEVAVIVVHIILIAFLYVAFRDDQSGKKSKLELLKETTGKKD